MPVAGCQESGFKMHFSNFYNRSLKGMLLLFIDSRWYNPWDIIQSYLLDLKVFVYSMQLVSNCYNFGLITEKHWCSYKGHYIPLTMTAACSRIEINPTMQDPDCFPQLQLHHSYYRTLFKSRVAFVQFVGRPQLKNGNLWLKTGSCSASYCSY